MTVLAGIVVVIILACIVFFLWTMCVVSGREDDQMAKLAKKKFGDKKDSEIHT